MRGVSGLGGRAGFCGRAVRVALACANDDGVMMRRVPRSLARGAVRPWVGNGEPKGTANMGWLRWRCPALLARRE